MVLLTGVLRDNFASAIYVLVSHFRIFLIMVALSTSVLQPICCLAAQIMAKKMVVLSGTPGTHGMSRPALPCPA